jgi:superfamily I DNA/RNA helicase
VNGADLSNREHEQELLGSEPLGCRYCFDTDVGDSDSDSDNDDTDNDDAGPGSGAGAAVDSASAAPASSPFPVPPAATSALAALYAASTATPTYARALAAAVGAPLDGVSTARDATGRPLVSRLMSLCEHANVGARVAAAAAAVDAADSGASAADAGVAAGAAAVAAAAAADADTDAAGAATVGATVGEAIVALCCYLHAAQAADVTAVVNAVLAAYAAAVDTDAASDSSADQGSVAGCAGVSMAAVLVLLPTVTALPLPPPPRALTGLPSGAARAATEAASDAAAEVSAFTASLAALLTAPACPAALAASVPLRALVADGGYSTAAAAQHAAAAAAAAGAAATTAPGARARSPLAAAALLYTELALWLSHLPLRLNFFTTPLGPALRAAAARTLARLGAAAGQASSDRPQPHHQTQPQYQLQQQQGHEGWRALTRTHWTSVLQAIVPVPARPQAQSGAFRPGAQVSPVAAAAAGLARLVSDPDLALALVAPAAAATPAAAGSIVVVDAPARAGSARLRRPWSPLSLSRALLGASLTCVGDDDQSIYSFRGGDGSVFQALFARFPPQCTLTVVLSQTYRSTRAILAAARGIIDASEAPRCRKPLWTRAGAGARVGVLAARGEDAEARRVVRRIVALHDASQREWDSYDRAARAWARRVGSAAGGAEAADAAAGAGAGPGAGAGAGAGADKVGARAWRWWLPPSKIKPPPATPRGPVTASSALSTPQSVRGSQVRAGAHATDDDDAGSSTAATPSAPAAPSVPRLRWSDFAVVSRTNMPLKRVNEELKRRRIASARRRGPTGAATAGGRGKAGADGSSAAAGADEEEEDGWSSDGDDTDARTLSGDPFNCDAAKLLVAFVALTAEHGGDDAAAAEAVLLRPRSGLGLRSLEAVREVARADMAARLAAWERKGLAEGWLHRHQHQQQQQHVSVPRTPQRAGGAGAGWARSAAGASAGGASGSGFLSAGGAGSKGRTPFRANAHLNFATPASRTPALPAVAAATAAAEPAPVPERPRESLLSALRIVAVAGPELRLGHKAAYRRARSSAPNATAAAASSSSSSSSPPASLAAPAAWMSDAQFKAVRGLVRTVHEMRQEAAATDKLARSTLAAERAATAAAAAAAGRVKGRSLTQTPVRSQAQTPVQSQHQHYLVVSASAPAPAAVMALPAAHTLPLRVSAGATHLPPSLRLLAVDPMQAGSVAAAAAVPYDPLPSEPADGAVAADAAGASESFPYAYPSAVVALASAAWKLRIDRLVAEEALATARRRAAIRGGRGRRATGTPPPPPPPPPPADALVMSAAEGATAAAAVALDACLPRARPGESQAQRWSRLVRGSGPVYYHPVKSAPGTAAPASAATAEARDEHARWCAPLDADADLPRQLGPLYRAGMRKVEMLFRFARAFDELTVARERAAARAAEAADPAAVAAVGATVRAAAGAGVSDTGAGRSRYPRTRAVLQEFVSAVRDADTRAAFAADVEAAATRPAAAPASLLGYGPHRAAAAAAVATSALGALGTGVDAGAGAAGGGVVLTTVHQAKGLEWPVVFVLRFNQGHMPMRRWVDQQQQQQHQATGDPSASAGAGADDWVPVAGNEDALTRLRLHSAAAAWLARLSGVPAPAAAVNAAAPAAAAGFGARPPLIPPWIAALSGFALGSNTSSTGSSGSSSGSGGSSGGHGFLHPELVRLAEERRLAYVALTRARYRLFLSFAAQSDKGEELQPSQFLVDVPDAVKDYGRGAGRKQGDGDGSAQQEEEDEEDGEDEDEDEDSDYEDNATTAVAAVSGNSTAAGAPAAFPSLPPPPPPVGGLYRRHSNAARPPAPAPGPAQPPAVKQPQVPSLLSVAAQPVPLPARRAPIRPFGGTLRASDSDSDSDRDSDGGGGEDADADADALALARVRRRRTVLDDDEEEDCLTVKPALS